LVSNSIENGAVLEALGSGQRVEGSLQERAAGVALILNFNKWFSGCAVVFGE
jgi:hypothetical protein